MSTTHELKCVEPWFSRVKSGEKTVEVRKHDRDFQVGDVLSLGSLWESDGYHEVGDGEPNQYHRAGQATGEHLLCRVTHVLPHHLYPEGVQPGYCVLSIRLVTEVSL